MWLSGSHWLSGGAIVAVLFTFIVANAIAGFIHRQRYRRIDDKLRLLSESRSASASRDIPVTIVTGFLGAGKTSLLNKLLSEPGGRKICLIENEVGAVSIDHALLESKSNAGVVVLKNGCMCCTSGGTGDELERTLDRLVSLVQPGQDSSLPFTHVVVETSGVADPAPIVQAFLRLARDTHTSSSPQGDQVSHTPSLLRFRLDSLVCVIDSKHAGMHVEGSSRLFSRSREIGQQLAYADVVLLNKWDIANESERGLARACVAGMNPTARVINTVRCDVRTDDIMDASCFDIGRAAELLAAQHLEDAAPSGGQAARASTATSQQQPLRGRHSGGVKAITIIPPAPVPLHRFQSWLQGVAASHWQSLYRVKGLLQVSGEGESSSSSRSLATQLFAVHGVHADIQGAFMEAPTRRQQAEGGGIAQEQQTVGSGATSCCSGVDGASHHTHDHHHHTHDPASCSSPPLPNALVLIGKGLPEQELRESFQLNVVAQTERQPAEAGAS